jgi:ABC-type sugar transport system ATPase subunit
MTGVPPHQRDAAMVFQHPALYPHLSVYNNLVFGLKWRGVSRTEARSRVNAAAGILGLDRLLTRRPSALSGGERQRVAIGRALVRRPRLILFDEPFASLDLPLRAALRDQVVELHRQFGTTLVHVTHDQAEALVMGDRIVVFDRGSVLQCATPREIYERPAHRFVATFVGSPPMNILPCQIEREGTAAVVRPIATDVAIPWHAACAPLPSGWEGTTRLFDLGVRPEAIQVRAPGSSTESRPSIASASVRRLEFNGPELIATLSVGPHRVIARLPASQSVDERQSVPLTLDLSRAVWFDQATGGALNAG